MRRSRLCWVVPAVAFIVGLFSVLWVTRYSVGECYGTRPFGCYVLDRWTGKVEFQAR